VSQILFRKLSGIPGRDIFRLEHHEGLKKSYRMLVEVNGKGWHIIPVKSVYEMFEDYVPASLTLKGGEQS
jgi:hypothetical protein